VSQVSATEKAEAERAAFLDALRALDRALDENVDRAHRMKKRIVELERECSAGRPVKEIVPRENSPLIVQLLTESADTLHQYGSRVRRTEARALHREGMTMDQIARLFGVTRQRVSALLREGT
jgi:DNA-directed RNA polymerase sigma subunit (sigma70/sigma32)